MRTRRRHDKKMGGACGSTGDYGSAVYGAAGSQSALEGSGNLIKLNPEAAQSGGKRKGKKGGSTLIDLGVPLVLLSGYAATRKSSRRKGGRRTRRR